MVVVLWEGFNRGVESDGQETHHDDGRRSEWMANGAGGEDGGGRQAKNASAALFWRLYDDEC